MGLWENLDDDYRNYLSDICTQEQFEAMPVLDRAELRYKFLEEDRKKQGLVHPLPWDTEGEHFVFGPFVCC